MSFFDKQFFVGVATGMAFVIVFLGACMVVAGYFVMKTMPEIGHAALELPEPSFPAEKQLSSYGKVDRNWTVQAVGGEKRSMADFEGRVVFLNVWATWCKPCVAEMPSIQRLVETLKEDSVAFLLVSGEEMETVKKFAATAGAKVPMFVWENSSPPMFQSNVIPATFVIDKAGNVVFRHTGAAKWDSESCQNFLMHLARANQPSPD